MRLVADALVIVLDATLVKPDNVVEVAPSAILVDPTVTLELTRPAFGNPVQFVSVPDAGVPNTGVVRVGLVSVLLVSVSVVALPTNVSVAAGSVKVVVPATADACSVVVPEVEPEMSIALGFRVTEVAMS